MSLPVYENEERSYWQPDTLPWDLIPQTTLQRYPRLEGLISGHRAIHELELESVQYRGVQKEVSKAEQKWNYRFLCDNYSPVQAVRQIWLSSFMERFTSPGDYASRVYEDPRLVFARDCIVFSERCIDNRYVEYFSIGINDGFLKEYVYEFGDRSNIFTKLRRRRRNKEDENLQMSEKGRQWGMYLGAVLKFQDQATEFGTSEPGQELLNIYAFESLYYAMFQHRQFGYLPPELYAIFSPKASQENINRMANADFYLQGCHTIMRLLSQVNHPLRPDHFDLTESYLIAFFEKEWAAPFYFCRAHPQLIPYLKFAIGVKILNELVESKPREFDSDRSRTNFYDNVNFGVTAVREYLASVHLNGQSYLISSALDIARQRGIEIPHEIN